MKFASIRGQIAANRLSKAGGSGLMLPKRVDRFSQSLNIMATAGDVLWSATDASTITAGWCYSGWLRPSTTNGTGFVLWNGSLGASTFLRNDVQKLSSDIMRSDIYDVGNNIIRSVDSSITVKQAEIIHVAISLEVGGLAQCFIDGIDVSVPGVDTAAAIFPSTRANLFARGDSSSFYSGAFADVWWNNAFFDLSGGGIDAFYDNGEPTKLGDRGEGPTGSIPIIYFGGDITANTGGAVGPTPGSGLNGGSNNGLAAAGIVTGGTFLDTTP